MCFAPRAQSSFGPWGIARGSVKFTTISDESAIHFPRLDLGARAQLIRAFSAWTRGDEIPGAMPQAERDVAPSARNANLRHPYKA